MASRRAAMACLAAGLVAGLVPTLSAQPVRRGARVGQLGWSGALLGVAPAAPLARPGGNLTGITALTLPLAGKRLELLKDARPGLARVAALANASHPGVQSELRESRAVAARLGLARPPALLLRADAVIS